MEIAAYEEEKEGINTEVTETRRALKRCRDRSNDATRDFINGTETQARKTYEEEKEGINTEITETRRRLRNNR